MTEREPEGEGGGQYKCGACYALFSTFEDQRAHYKSEWHKFNLKRKVAGLPPGRRKGRVKVTSYLNYFFESPATEKDYNEKMAVPEPAKEPAKTKFPCSSCNKVFSSANAHQSHLRSKAHISNAKVEAASQSEEKKEILPVKEENAADVKTEQQAVASNAEKESESAIPVKEKKEEGKPTPSSPVLTPRHCLFCSKKHKNRES